MCVCVCERVCLYIYTKNSDVIDSFSKELNTGGIYQIATCVGSTLRNPICSAPKSNEHRCLAPSCAAPRVGARWWWRSEDTGT